MEKLGIGIVGAGWVSGEHIRAYQRNPNTEVRAITSRREYSIHERMEETGVECEIFTDYHQMLAEADIDIVSICTPNHLHAEETIHAAEAKKHILIEKPVALNLEDLIEMREAVRQAGVKTVVSFVLRWNPLFLTIKSLLEDGAVGEIFYAEVDYLHGISDWYRGWNWVTSKEKGGSSLLAAGCHAVDAIRWFVGDEIEEVMAYSTKADARYEYDPTIVAILKFAGGTVGKVASSLECKMPYVFDIEILGDKGSMRNNKIWSHKFPGQTDFASVPTILPDSGDVTHHPFEGEIDHFVQCILEDRESFVNLEDAYNTHEICLAVDRSAETGEPVKLPLA